METAEKIDVIGIVLLGTFGMISLVAFIILFVVFYQKRVLTHRSQLQENENKHQRQLLIASVEIAEQEREKIASNIHDDVGVPLNALKLNISKIKRNLHDKELSEQVLQNSADLLTETIVTLRAISHDLMPPTLVKLGCIKGVRELCRQIDLSEELKVSFETNAEDLTFEKKDEIQLYRLIKEIINNIIKHAGASAIHVQMQVNDGVLVTEVSHNGAGISTEMVKELAEVGKGIGLKSILSRAQLTDSVIQFIVMDSKNSKITIETPVQKKLANT